MFRLLTDSILVALVSFALLAIHRSLVADLRKIAPSGSTTAYILARKPIACALCMSWWYSLASSMFYVLWMTPAYNLEDTVIEIIIVALASTGLISAFRRMYPVANLNDESNPYLPPSPVDIGDRDQRPPIA